MQWLDKLEQKFGKFGVPNITIVLIVAHCVFFFLYRSGNTDFLAQLPLVGASVIHGEYWRLFTFVLMPKCASLFWFIFTELLFYIMGTALERHWGAFRFNVFLGISWAVTCLASMIFPYYPADSFFMLSSVLIAFAILEPNFPINLYFIVTIPVKYLAVVQAFYIASFVFDGISSGNVGMAVMPIAGVSNLIVFFSSNFHTNLHHNRRRMDFDRKMKAAKAEPMHTCAVCGRTDQDDRYLDFRYVKRDGETLCLCEDHLDGMQPDAAPNSNSDASDASQST